VNKMRPTSHNKSVTASPPSEDRATKNRSWACALCAVFLRHIWGRGQCYALPYCPTQTSYTAGTLCEIAQKMF
jgi:hypothetical protein